MASGFLLVLLACAVLPPLLSRLLGLERWLPLVFVQLLLGMLLAGSGALDTLRGWGLDLQQGALASSLQGLGWLGLCLLIALGTHSGDAASADSRPSGWRLVPRFVSISVFGFLFTAAIGAGFGWWLAGQQAGLVGPNADRAGFAAALGLLLAVTALPVLLAIVAQMGLASTPLGRLAARCASLDDLWLWLAMGAVLACGAQSDSANAARGPVAALVLGVAFVLLRRPLARLFARPMDTGMRLLASLVWVLACAASTEAAGLHAVLGAYAGGVLLPPSALHGWREPVLRFSNALLLPLFFVHSGMAVHIDAADPGFWMLALQLTAVAVLAKAGIVTLLARATGLAWREAAALGALMQCKGLMELVAVGVLHQAGMIDGSVASALTVLALASTVLTAPLVRLALGQRASIAPARSASSGITLVLPAAAPARGATAVGAGVLKGAECRSTLPSAGCSSTA